MIILCSIYAGSALAEPISLLCTTEYELLGEGRVPFVESYYIDIEKEEMFKGNSQGKYWEALEDVRITKISVSGYTFYGSKANYQKDNVDRTNLVLTRTSKLFRDTAITLPIGKCEIADFDIETAF